MTRQEAIEHWKIVCETVMTAENNLHDTLQQIVKKDIEPEEKKDEYLTAVATEILKTTTDEQLKEM